MNFEEGKFLESFGEKLGFFLMYLVFTGFAYLLFHITHKIPDTWTYFHMIPFTLCVILLGILLMQWFKL